MVLDRQVLASRNLRSGGYGVGVERDVDPFGVQLHRADRDHAFVPAGPDGDPLRVAGLVVAVHAGHDAHLLTVRTVHRPPHHLMLLGHGATLPRLPGANPGSRTGDPRAKLCRWYGD